MRIFDAHCDTLSRSTPRGHWNLDEVLPLGEVAQIFAIYADSGQFAPQDLPAVFDVQYHKYQALTAQEGVRACTTWQEAERAFSAGQVATFLSVEGAELLGCSLAGLDKAYRKGVRAVTLTWNHANALSGTHADQPARGLSDAGRAFVGRMQDLGMLVDVSHLSEAGFWAVLQEAKRPILASHSNAKEICRHSRNLSDAQISALIQNGGVMGLNFYVPFLGAPADFDRIARHIDHVLALGGENTLALGGDWDGCDQLPQGMEQGFLSLLSLYDFLSKRYPAYILENVYHKNLARVVNEVCIM